MKRPVLIGIAGGTGSGKTTVANALIEAWPPGQVLLIQFDSYYKNLSHLPLEERAGQNFDHPGAIDETLLLKHVQALLNGQIIRRPVYDFTTHLRKSETVEIKSCDVIILEGILALHFPALRALMDLKVFIDSDADIRLIRRLKRDLQERGRTLNSILTQYQETVRPMHVRFVEPSKEYADIIIPYNEENISAIEGLKLKIERLLQKKVIWQDRNPARFI